MDVDDELNGSTEFIFDAPTEQNKMWARHLGDVLLGRPSVPDVSRASIHTALTNHCST